MERRCAPKILEVLTTAAPAHAESVPTTLFGNYFAYWETQGLLMQHGLAARHLITRSNSKGRLLERSSSLNDNATSAPSSRVKGKKKVLPKSKVAPDKKGKGKGKGKKGDADEAPQVNQKQLAKMRQTELEIIQNLVEESAQARLAARISNTWWVREGSANGSAGFIPPHVKARELRQSLELYAESLLDPEWVPAFDEVAAVTDTGSLLKQLFRMGGMAEAMNAVTPTVMGAKDGTNWWIDEDGDADGGDYDDSNTSGAGTGYRRDWYGGPLGPEHAIEKNADKEKEIKESKEGKPELYPVKKRRKLTKEEEEDELWLATKKGMSLAQVVPLRYKKKGSKVVERPVPWKKQFLNGFVNPLLKVLKRFLTMEIKAVTPEEQRSRVRAVRDVLLQGFQGIYDPVAKEFIDSDYELPSFLEEMAKINSRLKDEREEAARKAAFEPPGSKARQFQARALQTKRTLDELYLAAHKVLPRFRLFMEDIATRSRAMQGSGVAPLKSMYRSMEKAAFRADGDQWSVDHVLDVIRGSLRFNTMKDFARCLRIIEEYEGVQIRRLKDRFSNPTDYGWRDCLLNIAFTDDPDQFICEVQLVHHQLSLIPEQGKLSWNDVTTYRCASELLKIVAELEKQRATSKPTRDYDEAKTAAPRTDAVYMRHLAQQKQLRAGQQSQSNGDALEQV